jgi:hypothetical protein
LFESIFKRRGAFDKRVSVAGTLSTSPTSDDLEKEFLELRVTNALSMKVRKYFSRQNNSDQIKCFSGSRG